MATSSFLASFYFICGTIIFFLGVMILRYATRDIVGVATALVLFFAGFGPILGAVGVILQQNLQGNTFLVSNLVENFDYTWEFFFPSLMLFALVYPKKRAIWKYIRHFVFILFFPHVFHLILVLVLLDRVAPERTFNFLANIQVSSVGISSFLSNTSRVLNVMMELLFKAHRMFFSLVNITYASASILLLRSSMKFEVSPRVYRQIRVVVWGLSVCTITYALGRTVPVLAGTELDARVVTAFINASLIIGGGSIGIAIVRYQFLDIRLIARKGFFYGTTIAVFAAIYLITIKQVTEYFYRATGTRFEFIETGLIIVFIIVFQPVFTRLEEFTEKLLMREEKGSRVRLRELSDSLLSAIEVSDLKDKIRSTLTKAFGTDEVETLFAEEILKLRKEDPYSIEVVNLMIRLQEPIGKLDFMQSMGFFNTRGKLFLRPTKKVVKDAVETLPGIVKRLASYELIVPVNHEDRFVAVLLVGEKGAGGRYTMEDQSLLSMLSSQIAAAISRIELLKEVVEKKVMEEELNIARTIQMNLLPSAPPVLEDYEAAGLSISSKHVGGDYYDFMHSDTHLAFAVADVSGKGVPASLLMASLQASLRSMMDRMDDPVSVISRLNDVMCDITAPDKFATMFYGCINIKKHEIIYTNAGHFFPVILREDGAVEELNYSGLILGVTPGFPYESRKVRIKPSETIVVTTDGVTEAESSKGELYGEERLHPFLASIRQSSADRIKDSIVEEVNRFSYPRGANDDMTILVIKRKA